MKNYLMQASGVIAVFALTAIIAGCGSSATTDNTGKAAVTMEPPENPPLENLAHAKQKLSFELVLPDVLPASAVLEGVGVTHFPANAPGSPSTPGAAANWAHAVYDWSKGRTGPWFHVFSIKEMTTQLGPPVAHPNASAITRGSPSTGPANKQPTVAQMGSPTPVSIDGVRVTRTVTQFNGLGSAGNEKGTTTDYQWESRGIGFDLTRFGSQISESMVRRMITSMIQ